MLRSDVMRDDEKHERDGSDAFDARLSRRTFVRAAGAAGGLAALGALTPAYARSMGRVGRVGQRLPKGGAAAGPTDLVIDRAAIRVGARRATATAINGTVPGPLLRFREGEEAVIRVTNRLREDTSVHWHGLIVPNRMDGVPGVVYPGIRPGETFTYQFPLRQYGTYWYHSHSGLQEQVGHYAPLIVDPAEPEPFAYDRDYVVMFSDWSFEDPYKVLDHIKKKSDYYNYQRRTVGDFISDVEHQGWRATIADRRMWAKMRMSPTDISDITGVTYTYLVNGLPPASNWTGLFTPGERVRLRFINAGAGTYFDVRLPGLEMTVVAVSGQHVQPVVTDEIRVGIAETYDVIVQPRDDRAYTIFAESMDRSGYARGTLATRDGLSADIPRLRHRPTLTMNDMGMSMGGMSGMGGMKMGGAGASGSDTKGTAMPGMDMGTPKAATADSITTSGAMPGMPGMAMPDTPKPSASRATKPDMAGMDMSAQAAKPTTAVAAMPGMAAAPTPTPRSANGMRAPGTIPDPVTHGPDTHGSANSAAPMTTQSRINEPGPGLGEDGWRVLVYGDLRSLKPNPDFGAPEREIELHLTGNMERYMWGFDGVKFSDVKEPIRIALGERFRLTFVNDTMMPHPMHLHGMWMELENGHGAEIPRVHTVNVKPGERLSLLATPDTPGPWALHCHVMLHMAMGMFRVVEVSAAPAPKVTAEASR
jgi:CopA family copper-resistance protein